MIQIRKSIFETNSSSTHSLTLCNLSDFEKWKNGELIYSMDDDDFIKFTDEIKNKKESGYGEEFLTYEEFFDYSTLEYETYEQHFKTKNGDEVVGFGYYGYD